MNEPLTLSKLFVLGLLAEKERHGYEFVQIADRWSIHRWAGISIGSIYSTLKRLEREKHIEAIRVEKDSNRPSRMIYQLTATGQRACLQMIEAGLGSLEFESRELDLALAFAHFIAPETRRTRLADRLKMIQERQTQLEWLNDHYAVAPTSDDPQHSEFKRLRATAPWIYAGVRHGLARIRVEADWTQDLLEEIDTWPYRPATTLTS